MRRFSRIDLIVRWEDEQEEVVAVDMASVEESLDNLPDDDTLDSLGVFETIQVILQVETKNIQEIQLVCQQTLWYSLRVYEIAKSAYFCEKM